MKILYHQSQLKRTLIIGIVYVTIGTTSLLISADNYILPAFLGIGFFYIGIFIYERNRPYVTITNESIIVDGFINKKITMSEIVSVKYFAGDYVIKSPNNELTIDTNMIDKNSLPQLREFMDSRISAK